MTGDARRALGLPLVPTRDLSRNFGHRMTSPATISEPFTTVDVVEASLATSTRQAYQAGWGRFMVWCDVHGIDDATTATPLDVADWITAHVNVGHSPSYIRRELAGVRHHLIRHGVTVPPTDHKGVRQAVAGAARLRGGAQRRAIPLSLDDMRRLVTGIALTTGRDLRHVTVRRDRAVVALGWAIAQRGANLVGLDVDDLTFTDDGLLVAVRRSKTDQTGRGHTIAVPWSTHQSTCAVRAAMILTRDRGSGALFRSIDRHRRIGGRLSVEAVTGIVRSHVAGVLQRDPTGYTSHSLRAGFVTEARARGVPDPVIMRRTGHTNANSLNRYDRPQDLLHEANEHLGEWW